MGRVTSYGTKGTELGATIIDRAYAPGLPALLYCHGFNGQGWQPVNFPDPVIELMAATGYPVSSHDLGGTATFGNDTCQAKVSDAIAYMQGAPLLAPAGPVLLWAGSMGTLTALNFLRANPSRVLAAAITLPAVDLADLHAQATFTAPIEAAYGGLAGYNAALATHSPVLNEAAYAALDVPTKLWYASDDPYIAPSIVTAFAAAAGVPAVNMGPGGHNFNPAFADDVADFLQAHA